MKEFFKKVITDETDGPLIGILKVLLWLLSLLFRLLVVLRGALFSLKVLPQIKLPKPVISVGNITLGGVGKTPLVSFIVKHLLAQGKKPVVLMRGYMDQSSKCCGAKSIDSDEAKMLNRITGVEVLVGADRVAQAQKYLKDHGCDCFILDDGFQHRRCARDLDIVVVDATNPFGNGHLLPRGILRESISAFKRADVAVLSKVAVSQDLDAVRLKIQKVNKDCLLTKSNHVLSSIENLRTKENFDLKFFEEKKIASFCSIANPQSFVHSIELFKGEHLKNFSFMDHHSYHQDDIKRINEYCLKNNVDVLMTTQKDAVKLNEFLDVFDQSFLVCTLNIEIQFIFGEESIIERINSLL